jgi:16S rRNA (cytosine1402-N4)-methyltransferase
VTEAFHHESVLPDEVIAELAPRPGGLYCDATLGGGGHARRILDASAPDGRLIGVDRDPQALDAARARLAVFGDRVTLVHGAFGDIGRLLDDLGVTAVDGFLIDVGVSSPQLDQSQRGFSFSREGPLDMRMDPTTGETCAELLRRVTTDELERILRDLGEERYARRIARAIKDVCGQLETTTELAAVVAGAMPGGRPRERIDPATRTFQALRIAVNDELGQLEQFLADAPFRLRTGGRLVVIAFHSLEDRIAKHRMRELCVESGLPPDIARAQGLPERAAFRLLTRHAVRPSDAEIERNPRSRSARLRAVERLVEAES